MAGAFLAGVLEGAAFARVDGCGAAAFLLTAFLAPATFLPELFRATAARMRAFRAFASIFSPSLKSMARRRLPSRHRAASLSLHLQELDEIPIGIPDHRETEGADIGGERLEGDAS